MTQKLRIRHAGGSATIDSGSNVATARDIGEKIAAVTGISMDYQVWKCGYPPQRASFVGTEPMPFAVDLIHVSEILGSDDEASLQFPAPTAAATVPEVADSTTSPTTCTTLDIAPLLSNDPPTIDPEGYAVRRVVVADNSCLFHSIGCAFQQQTHQQGLSFSLSARKLREAVAHAVLTDPTIYSEAFLGRPPSEYADWIQISSSWGGQIELSILSPLLQTEIVALDIIRNRHDVYGSDRDIPFQRRIFVIYDGIHYDAVAYTFDPQLPADMDITQFSPKDEVMLSRAQDLCRQEYDRKSFTDTSSFTLRCLVCQQGLRGQKEAAQHAQETDHANFAEYRVNSRE